MSELDDPMMRNFVRIKSTIMDAQAEFGEDLGIRLVAAAMKMQKLDPVRRPLPETYADVRREWLVLQAEPKPKPVENEHRPIELPPSTAGESS